MRDCPVRISSGWTGHDVLADVFTDFIGGIYHSVSAGDAGGIIRADCFRAIDWHAPDVSHCCVDDGRGNGSSRRGFLAVSIKKNAAVAGVTSGYRRRTYRAGCDDLFDSAIIWLARPGVVHCGNNADTPWRGLTAFSDSVGVVHAVAIEYPQKKTMVENLITRQHFEQMAAHWHSSALVSNEKIDHLLQRLDFSRCRSILDLGCGTGVLFRFLIQLTRREAQIFACDFAEAMTHLAVQQCGPGPILLCACARYLPFQNNRFDLIIAFHVFPHIRGKLSALQECWRVLKPGGELVIMHAHSSREINTIHNQIGGAVKNHRLPSGADLGRMLNLVGFQPEQIIDQPGEYFVKGFKMDHHTTRLASISSGKPRPIEVDNFFVPM